MKSLLTMKHWQLFLLMIGFPLFVLMCSLVAIYAELGDEWPVILIFFSIITCILLTLYWHYVLVSHLIRLYPPGLEFKNIGLFKASVFGPIIFILLTILSLVYLAYNPGWLTESDLKFLFILLPLIGVMFVANLYCIYKTAEALVTVELQRKPTTGDLIVEFILIMYFWIIGIWFLQPRINRIFNREDQIPAIPNVEFLSN